ncbi:FbpB family small basic protein [Shouchella shacheensis]|nr:FbpB family small basic protein [Shouchella shacheensis]
MRKLRKLSYAELIRQNRERLMQDERELERLEDRFERRHSLPK